MYGNASKFLPLRIKVHSDLRDALCVHLRLLHALRYAAAGIASVRMHPICCVGVKQLYSGTIKEGACLSYFELLQSNGCWRARIAQCTDQAASCSRPSAVPHPSKRLGFESAAGRPATVSSAK
jgi:hypothetical protein